MSLNNLISQLYSSIALAVSVTNLFPLRALIAHTRSLSLSIPPLSLSLFFLFISRNRLPFTHFVVFQSTVLNRWTDIFPLLHFQALSII